MQTISVQTTQNVFIQHPIASVGERILAYLIDTILLMVYITVVVAAFINLDLEIIWIWVMTIVVPLFFYHLAFEIFMNGQSPGKRVMNIQVVRLDGTQPSIGDYLLRWFFGFVDIQLVGGAV